MHAGKAICHLQPASSRCDAEWHSMGLVSVGKARMDANFVDYFEVHEGYILCRKVLR